VTTPDNRNPLDTNQKYRINKEIKKLITKFTTHEGRKTNSLLKDVDIKKRRIGMLTMGHRTQPKHLWFHPIQPH
jgi:hypothetical protein